MGNSQVKTKHSQSQNGSLIHDRLGPIKVTQFHDNQIDQTISQMQIQKSVQSQRIIDDWKNQIIRIDDTQSKQILLLPKKTCFQKGGMCGSSGTVSITYQNLSYVLKGQIQNRFKINRYFEQRQIWYLLYNMIRAGNKFQRIKRKVGNIHPNNILINDDGQIKLIATCSIPGQQTNFQLLTQNHDAQAFLAPQQLANDSLINIKYPANVNQCLAQVFCIGLTTLSAGTLLDCQSAYQKRKDGIKINQNTLQNLLKSFKQRYSSFLFDTVQNMVALNPNNRKRSSDIYEILYPYENQILDLEPFNPPMRYQIPQQSQIITNIQPNQMISSNTHVRNVYPQQNYQIRQVINPQINPNSVYIGNESSMQRSDLPVYIVNQQPQIIRSNNADSMVYVNQTRMNNPLHTIYGQQSGHYVQQSGVFPMQQSVMQHNNFIGQPNAIIGQQSGVMGQHNGIIEQQNGIIGQKQSYFEGSKIIQGSNYPPTQFSNIQNSSITQSNYIPNYQFRQ